MFYNSNTFAVSSTVRAWKIPLRKVAGLNKSFHYFVHGLFNIWVLSVIVAEPAVQTVRLGMIDPRTGFLSLYDIIPAASSYIFLYIIRIECVPLLIYLRFTILRLVLCDLVFKRNRRSSYDFDDVPFHWNSCFACRQSYWYCISRNNNVVV